MASSSFALQVILVQKTSISQNSNLRNYFSYTVLKELLHIPMKVNVSRFIKDTSSKMLDAFVDSVFKFVDQPYLPSQSNFAPVEEIGHDVMIDNIEGEIPTDFPMGIYIRNGPNPLFGGLKTAISWFGQSSHCWIEGEGMLHALYFIKDSQECWTVLYNNRYVETETFIQEKKINKPSFLPAIEGNSPAILAAYLLNMLRFGKVNKYISNTSIFEHSGMLYSVAENHLPQVIDFNTLETISQIWDVDGAWKRPFTAHPKKVPGTGELVIVGVDAVKPFFVLGVVSADGKKLLHEVDLKFERSTICHEIGITQKYNIILDCPLTIDINRLIKGGPLVKYDKEEYAKIGVMLRYGDSESVRWFEVAPHCTFHILNCFEYGDEVVVRGCRAPGSIIPGPDFGHDKTEWFSRGFQTVALNEATANINMEYGHFFSRAYEWRLNMMTGEVKEKYLTGTSFSLDFPMINEKYTGIRNKYGYTQVVDSIASSNSGMAKYGMLAKLYFEESATRPKKEQINSEELIKVEYHKFEKNSFCSGATFLPKHGQQNEEDEGWILCFVHNEETDISEVHIIETKHFESKPVAKITLPQRVPYGFHGAYFPKSVQQQNFKTYNRWE
ncbi:hypothetical protein AQUCO_02000338v1 [Aquilegia coerulea]|uniref:Uncharacterized protein n=1 Tax=Aquilegia coerulea TaxID=218851 RepID=A0A2G5DH17_AQUCA|nr:hypothetical protein AQUCO_02000338v1 [Aquilegia coerulea]